MEDNYQCTLRITNPRTLQSWKDKGWFQKQIDAGFIYAIGCGRFKTEICTCTKCRKNKDAVLKRFMKEFFHFPTLCKVGFFTEEMKNDYKAQAERVCKRFGFNTVYEYRATEIKCHLTSDNSNEPFVTVLPSIYE